MPLKIAIAVHGRFHAFDLAQAMLGRGHEVTLFTNYPHWAVKRFGIARQHVKSFTMHGVLSRFAWHAQQKWNIPYPEAGLHRLFGRWVAAQLRQQHWDLIHSWSGISEEILDSCTNCAKVVALMRGSAHIRVQDRLLQEEETRSGIVQERPSEWMIAREEREYVKADKIVVLSSFARQSFIDSGICEQKLELNLLGVEVKAFRPSVQTIEERCQRILSGAPLRVLYVGTKSFRKGMWDLSVVVQQLSKKDFQFRLVGPKSPETEELLSSLHTAELVNKQPQNELFKQYNWADIFLFPTIEDGFAVVLAQANANALPILTTANCAGPDIICEGKSGWVLPIRKPESIVERLQWCQEHRQDLVEMIRWIYEEFKPRTWIDTAIDLERCVID